MARRGVAIVRVEPGSAAHKAGVRSGQRVISVNGESVGDALDFRWLISTDDVSLELGMDGGKRTLRFSKEPDDSLGVQLAHPRWRACRNKCVFCFVDQLPRGLRRSLYFKDEDYRLSFLNGSYITLTGLVEEDIARILQQRLTPLYVSIHATDPDLRAQILGRPGTPPVVPLLRRLTAGGIRLHAQVVLCPGINDGVALDETIETLSSLHPGVASLAVVPVGITTHRAGLPRIEAVTRSVAVEALDQIERWRQKLLARIRSRFVHLSDEFYLLASRTLPAAHCYEGFPQIEDGVGMARTVIDRVRSELRRLPKAARKAMGDGRVLVTGTMAAPLLRELLEETRASVAEVRNVFLGGGVTVSGLLAGSDLMAAGTQLSQAGELLLPSNLLDCRGRLLDDWTPARLGQKVGVRARVVPYLGKGLVAALRDPQSS